MQVLNGKVSIITGAGRGIGRAIALLLARSGSRVVLAARTQSDLEGVKNEIQKHSEEVLTLSLDLTKDDAMETLVEKTLEQWGTIDYLINNAGWGKTAPLVKGNVEDWDQTFKVNLRTPMVLSKLVLPTLMKKGGGAIINMGSVSGRAGSANTAAYSASKFGLLGFSQSLYEEVREFGIKVAVIMPGFVDTPLIPPNRRLNRRKMIQPEDVAQAVLFVLSSSTTGCPVEIVVRPQRTPYT